MKKIAVMCSLLLLAGMAQAQIKGNLASAIAGAVVSTEKADKFLEAVAAADLRTVRWMLADTRKTSHLVNVKDKDGNTPLMRAIQGLNSDLSTYTRGVAAKKREDYIRIIELLGESGAYVNTTNEKGWTALCMAAQGSYPRVVSYLLARNAHVDHLCGGKKEGVTPLLVATHSKDLPEMIQLLVDAGADVNFLSPFRSYLELRSTPLMGAVDHGDVESVGILLDAGADINAETRGTVEGMTAAWIAVQNRDWFMLQYLVEHGGHLFSYLDGDVLVGIRERDYMFPGHIREYLESKGYDFNRPTRLRVFLYQGGDYVNEYSAAEMEQLYKTGKLKKK